MRYQIQGYGLVEMRAALEAVVDRYAPTASPANDAIAVMWAKARAALAKVGG